MIGLHALFIEDGVEYRARRDKEHDAFTNPPRRAIGGEALRQMQRAREEAACDVHDAERAGGRREGRRERRDVEVHVRFQKMDFGIPGHVQKHSTDKNDAQSFFR